MSTPTDEFAFIRGIRAAVRMLDPMGDDDAYYLQSTGRGGAPQDNAVLTALDAVLAGGSREELAGFCAVLTEIAALAEAAGDQTRLFSSYAARRQRLALKRASRQALRKGDAA